jgi:hypothetical protein
VTLMLPRRPAKPATPKAPVTARLVDGMSSVLAARTTRRGFLARTAVVGSALAVAPGAYVLKPGTAYANICGPDSACSSGYTAFCCTINGGRNVCPPGNYVGGWWKADGSGFCCGRPRYYVDCHEPCTRCTTGCGTSQFCRGCVASPCRCSNSSGCDQRKTNCNYFRYGQCRQDIGCGGPVNCRVVSCTPPWQQGWGCSTASATDNRTLNHSSDCLPGHCPGAIERKYFDLGGPGSFLGRQRSGEQRLPDGTGRITYYERGLIYWHPSTGAWSIRGAILDRYGVMRWETGVLGYPVTDERGTPDGRGRFNHFQRGSIYWTPGTGAWDVYGAIRDTWRSLGWERSALGYPVAGEAAGARGSRFSRFQRGEIHWSHGTGAREVRGNILIRWRALGGPGGAFGLPVSNELPIAGGRVSRFQFGSIYFSHATPRSSGVQGDILARYRQEGETASRLGFPTTDEYSIPGGRASDFQRGRITWEAATRRTTVVAF